MHPSPRENVRPIGDLTTETPDPRLPLASPRSPSRAFLSLSDALRCPPIFDHAPRRIPSLSEPQPRPPMPSDLRPHTPTNPDSEDSQPSPTNCLRPRRFPPSVPRAFQPLRHSRACRIIGSRPRRPKREQRSTPSRPFPCNRYSFCHRRQPQSSIDQPKEAASSSSSTIPTPPSPLPPQPQRPQARPTVFFYFLSRFTSDTPVYISFSLFHRSSPRFLFVFSSSSSSYPDTPATENLVGYSI